MPRLASLTGGSFDILLAMICSCIKLLRKYQNAFNKSKLRFSCCIILFYRKEALVTNRATYPVDDVVEPEDEDYIDAEEG